jgi:hypothetical protein
VATEYVPGGALMESVEEAQRQSQRQKQKQVLLYARDDKICFVREEMQGHHSLQKQVRRQAGICCYLPESQKR